MVEEGSKYSEDYYIKVLFDKMKVRELMSSPAVSLHVDAKFSEVPQKFNEHGIRHLPIVGDDGRLVGLMTQRDLYKVESPRKLDDGSWYYDQSTLDNVILRAVMVQNPFSMQADDTIAAALTKMVECKYGCIPVVDQSNVLCGVITQSDILKTIAKIVKD